MLVVKLSGLSEFLFCWRPLGPPSCHSLLIQRMPALAFQWPSLSLRKVLPLVPRS